MQQASVGFHCPECTRQGAQRVYNARSLTTTQPVVTLALIAVNIVAFLFDVVSISPSPDQLGDVARGGALLGPDVADGDWWRPVTAGFVHAGLLHVGLNMFILYQLGRLLEPALGRIAFLALYGMSLLGGSLLVLVLDPDVRTVGASGAVFGLMGAAVVALRARGINPFSTSIGMLLVINLIITFAGSAFISVGGHIGGLVAGLIGGWFLFELAPMLNANTGARGASGHLRSVGHWAAVGLCAASAVLLYGACLYIASNPV
jgi:membrane associated rhomboid family serine protease